MTKSFDDSNSDVGPSRSAATGDAVGDLLKNSRTIAVVGLSSRSHRPSYGVAEYLQSAGY